MKKYVSFIITHLENSDYLPKSKMIYDVRGRSIDEKIKAGIRA